MQTHISATVDTQFTKLQAFRQAAYACLGNGRAAQFDLADAVLVTPAVNSFAELALAPVFRRRWASLYEALQDGRPDREALLRLYVQHLPPSGTVLVAGDHTAWPRLAAPTLRDRKIVHAPTKIAGNRPITIGADFSTVSWVPESAGSWAPPLLFERISSAETPLQKGADQLRSISKAVQALDVRLVSLWDSEYGCAPFVNTTYDIPADKLFRLRPNLCLWGPPPPYPGRGRPAVHGPAFKLREPLTWGQPASKLELLDPNLGRVQVLVWRLLHFRKAGAHPLVVARIERLDAAHTARDPGVLWVGWQGAEPPPLATWWDWYLRRFAVDQAGLALDAAPVGDPRAGRTLERSAAVAHLAALAGPHPRQRRAVTVAEAPTRRAQDAGPGAPRHGGTFGRDWHTGSAAETPRKSARVAGRARAQAP
jgi:hypothetical protein